MCFHGSLLCHLKCFSLKEQILPKITQIRGLIFSFKRSPKLEITVFCAHRSTKTCNHGDKLTHAGYPQTIPHTDFFPRNLRAAFTSAFLRLQIRGFSIRFKVCKTMIEFFLLLRMLGLGGGHIHDSATSKGEPDLAEVRRAGG